MSEKRIVNMFDDGCLVAASRDRLEGMFNSLDKAYADMGLCRRQIMASSTSHSIPVG